MPLGALLASWTACGGSTLERRGLIRRMPHPADRRKLLIAITSQGRAIVDDMLPSLHSRERTIIRDAPTETEQRKPCVVVMPPALDGARVAASTLDWLEEHGYSHLVRGSVAVVNAVRDVRLLDLDRIEEHFRARCHAVRRVPWDPALEAGGQTSYVDLRPATQSAYLDLAAAVADGFAASDSVGSLEQAENLAVLGRQPASPE
jgi:MinD-like ATPase involved in chromosome partitioning or flagellar assembly